MIRLSGVTVAVPTPEGPPKTLLQDVTLDLTEPRICVIGANGSGKSTLLRLLNGLVVPNRGSVTVHGHDTVRDGREVRRAVGFVFTDPLSQLVLPTAVEDVELSLRRTHQDRRTRRARARELLQLRGLAEVAESSIYDLSGGERQLVALTAVLAVEPRVVVADEPTTLLDLRNRDLVRRELATLTQQLVVATHDLEWAAEFGRVLVVDRGRITFDGDGPAAVASYRTLVTA